jgi:molybdate transport repressor ModE-like protein
MLDARKLRLLREVQARGTIAAVAQALSFSASAVSQQLAQLEREVGTSLLERAGRGVRLTSAGELLARHSEIVVMQLERAASELEAIKHDVSGFLRVATFQTAARALVPFAVAILSEQHPGLRVDVVEEDPVDSLPALAIGDFDFVIGHDYAEVPQTRPANIDFEELLSDRMLLALPVNHELADQTRPISLSSLAGERWAVGLAGTSYEQVVVRACRARGSFDPDIRYHSNDFGTLLAFVAARQAVALVPALASATSDPRIRLLELGKEPIRRSIFTATRNGSSRRPGVVALRRALRRSVERLDGSDSEAVSDAVL